MDKADYEEEAGLPATKSERTSYRPMFEAAALLLMWSVLVLNEGSIRFVRSFPAGDGLRAREDEEGNRTIPRIVFVVFSIFECIFGILGIIVAAWALLLKGGNVKTTGAFLFVQSLLGWPVFLLYVWSEPAFAARNAGPNPDLGFSESAHKFAHITGLLASLSFCLALQGGQFVMGLRLLSYQSGEKVATKSINMNKGRTLFWNANMVLGGFATFALGCLLIDRTGAGRVATYAFPPNVGVYPVITLITGLFMLSHGLLGLASAFAKGLVKLLLIYTIPVYIVMYLNFVMWQIGAIKPPSPMMPPAFAAGMHSGLVIVTIGLGTYFALKHSEE